MGHFTLTAAELHAELAEMQAHRTAYADATGGDTGFEMTACPEDFERMVVFAARRAVYGEGVWEAEAAAELGIGLVNHTRERRVQRLVAEATALVKNAAEVEGLPEGFTIGAAFEAAAKNEHAVRSIRKAATRITVGATEVHRDDTSSLTREAAARAISGKYTKSTATPFDAAPAAAYRILAGIEALVAYLNNLAAPLIAANLRDLHFSTKTLRREAADALDSHRYAYGISREVGRAARDLAAFESNLAGLDDEAQADAWLAREERIAEWAASEKDSEREKASAAAEAPAALATRTGISMDAQDAPQLDGEFVDDGGREEALFDGLGAAWAAIAPQFGYADPQELAAAVAWRTNDAKQSKVFTAFFGDNNSRAYRAATTRARALDIAEVRQALADALTSA